MGCVGFGHGAFGGGPGSFFGLADWGEESLFATIPLIYREEDVHQGDLLRKTVNGYKPPFNELRNLLDRIPSQADPRECDIRMLRLLGANFGAEIDDTKDELFRRSAVIHYAQQLLLKGQDQGYRVIGAVNGYNVVVERLNETECGSGVLTTEPPRFVPLFDETPADMVPVDVDYADEFALWERVETFTPAAGTTTLTLANNFVRFVHVFRNGVELPQDTTDPPAKFHWDGSHTITLFDPSEAGDVYVVREIDGFRLHNALPPDPRCRSHSLKATITLGPEFGGSVTPLDVFSDRINRKVKPIHVTFEELVYVVTFPTVETPTSVTMEVEVTGSMLFEEEQLFDVSAGDTETTDEGLKTDMK